jgi:hypothetical protein
MARRFNNSLIRPLICGIQSPTVNQPRRLPCFGLLHGSRFGEEPVFALKSENGVQSSFAQGTGEGQNLASGFSELREVALHQGAGQTEVLEFELASSSV